MRRPLAGIKGFFFGRDPVPSRQGRRAASGNHRLSQQARASSPLDLALRAIGDPWSFLIQQEAFFGVRRFGDFQRNLNIAKNTLTDRLAMLVDYGLLAKKKRDERTEVHEYRLTPRGLDTYPYALCLMKWGDDWLAGKEAPPVVLHHRTCGARLQPLAICTACEREVVADDIQIDLGAIVDSVREEAAQVRVSSRPELYTAGRPTSVSRTLAVIGDRWGFFVVWLALAGVTRFEHFHNILKIARTTLTARLNHLVEHGIFERVTYQTRPPRHEYRLTEKGKALSPVLLALHDWGLRGLPRSRRQTSVLHRSCGMPLTLGVVCRSCRTTPLPGEVDVKQVRIVPPTQKPAAARPASRRRPVADRR